MFQSKKNSFSALILAGGMSSRTGGISKQQYLLLDIPVVVRSIMAFEACTACREILVVSRADECPLYAGFKDQYGLKKLIGVVPGGATRQESAFIGMEQLPDAEYIAIHDAARCLILPEQIEKIFKAAKKYRSAAAACPAVDTVKQVDRAGKTLPGEQLRRDDLRCMQTPQIFYADLYRAAAYTAKEEGFTGTDDCSLLERVGFGVHTVDCGSENMKITSPTDFIIAEAILKQRLAPKED